jgi:hypothetical protein
MQDVKQCKTCKEIKNVNEFYLFSNGIRSYTHSNCKECHKKYSREKSKIWRLNNKDDLKQYCEENKEKFKQYHKEYYQENKEKLKQYYKKYYRKNKDKVLSQNTKKCYNCKEIKTLDNFYCSKKEKIFRSLCKECDKKISKKYYQDKKQKNNQCVSVNLQSYSDYKPIHQQGITCTIGLIQDYKPIYQQGISCTNGLIPKEKTKKSIFHTVKNIITKMFF